MTDAAFEEYKAEHNRRITAGERIDIHCERCGLLIENDHWLVFRTARGLESGTEYLLAFHQDCADPWGRTVEARRQ